MLRIACIAAALLLAACSSEPTLPQARCHAAGATAELGKPLDDRTRELARMGAGAVRADVVPYGIPVVRHDVDPQRLNIEVDRERVIQRLRCG
jgi:hypothetical protein